MKKMVAVLLAVSAAFVVGSSAMAFTDPVVPMKWSQPIVKIGHVGTAPLYTGWDEKSWSRQVPPNGPFQAADDWQCKNDLPVTDIHWWGSYVNWKEPVPSFSPAGFWFGIYNDIPADPSKPGSFSHPGDLVWDFRTTNYREVFVGYDGAFDAAGNAVIHDSTFQYNVDIPKAVWFYQKGEPGTVGIYWLSIVAIYPTGVNYEWGWKTRPHFFQDDAVRLTSAGLWQPIYGPDDRSWDLAFELSTVPEPGSMVLLTSGLVGLIGLATRRKR